MIFILADLLIKWKFLISGVLFLIRHILLIVCFCMEKKPTRKGIAVWAVLTVAEAPLMIRLLGQYGFSPAVGCAGAVYGSVLALMVVCALRQAEILAAGAIMFACSDICLALYKASAGLWWMHAPSILLFYMALGMFLIYCSGCTGSLRHP